MPVLSCVSQLKEHRSTLHDWPQSAVINFDFEREGGRETNIQSLQICIFKKKLFGERNLMFSFLTQYEETQEYRSKRLQVTRT